MRCMGKNYGLETEMTLLIGQFTQSLPAVVSVQNVGMLQIDGVLAHNNPDSLPFTFPLFHDSGDPHGSTRHSLYRSVG